LSKIARSIGPTQRYTAKKHTWLISGVALIATLLAVLVASG